MCSHLYRGRSNSCCTLVFHDDTNVLHIHSAPLSPPCFCLTDVYVEGTLFFLWQTLCRFTQLNHLHAVGMCRKQSLSVGTHFCYFIKQPASRCKQQEWKLTWREGKGRKYEAEGGEVLGFFQVSLHFHMHNMMHIYKVNKPIGVKKKNIHTVKCMQGVHAVLYTSVDSTSVCRL